MSLRSTVSAGRLSDAAATPGEPDGNQTHDPNKRSSHDAW